MLWTREAVLQFTSLVFAEYAGREMSEVEKEQAARKARVVDFDAAKTLKRTDARVVIAGDISRFYVKEHTHGAH